jgi:hypothetical protein
MERMLQGDFEGAWRLSDLSLASRPVAGPETPRHEQRIWDGSPLRDRRVLVRCYHGLGDTIQFVRYIPLLRRLAREVTVWIQPALIDLLSGTPDLGRLMPLHEGSPAIEFDAEIEIMELPHAFRTVEETIPRDVPYIQVAPATLPPSGLTRVGLVWTAGSWDPRRSVPFSELENLLRIPGTCFTPFQGTSDPEALSHFGGPRPEMPLRALAEHVAAQDLVITVDTMMAHLAGALGVPTCLLLHAEADWRWMRGRRDTPWYPRTTIYRQSNPRNWGPVIEALRADLPGLIAPPREGGAAREAETAKAP